MVWVIPLGWVIVGALWWRPLADLALPRAVIAGGVLVTISTTLTVALVPAAFGLGLLLERKPAGRTTYLLQDGRRRAGVVVDGVDTARWEVKTLAAWPRSVGAGTALLVALLDEADRQGADLELWCTKFLEDWYREFGFVTAGQRMGMRRMHRPSPSIDR